MAGFNNSINTNNTELDILTNGGALNIGTDAVQNVTTIGNITGTTAVNINAGSGGSLITMANSTFAVESGTGAINIGADAVQKTITVGNATGATAIQINSGTGGAAITTV